MSDENKKERIETAIREFEEASIEYCETHDDEGQNYLDCLYSDSWSAAAFENLKEWFAENGIQTPSKFLEHVKEEGQHLFEAIPGHIFSGKPDSAFLLDCYPVGEIETQIEKNEIMARAQVSRDDLEKYLASDQREFCLRNQPASDCFETYAPSDVVWQVQLPTESAIEMWTEWQEEK